jgi:hypothetical protein
LPSPNAIARLSFDLTPTRYYFRFVQRDVTSLSRRFARRIRKFDSSLELRPSFHVALHNIHCLRAVAPTPTLLPLNSFLSSFVRQFHFTSRTALPTFITLFQDDFPRTVRKQLFRFLVFSSFFSSNQLALDKMTPFSAALLCFDSDSMPL